MSAKKYLTIVMPLNDAAQAMIGLKSGQYQLRATLWSCAAERMKALLGKTCSMFTPAIKPIGCGVPLPFGVALGAVEPHEFLVRYFSARESQANDIHARVQKIQGMSDTVFTKQLTDRVEMAVLAVDMSDPAFQREMEYAKRFFQGDITAAGGLYLLGADQCRIEDDLEKMILSHLDEYAICVAQLEV